MAPNHHSAARILVIDDEPLMLEVLKIILEGSGYAVVLTGGASQALALLAQETFDLIITDYQMPGMKGDKLAALIKARMPSQKILILTGAADELLSSGNPVIADVILRKPFRTPELQSVLGRLLRPKAFSSSVAVHRQPSASLGTLPSSGAFSLSLTGASSVPAPGATLRTN